LYINTKMDFQAFAIWTTLIIGLWVCSIYLFNCAFISIDDWFNKYNRWDIFTDILGFIKQSWRFYGRRIDQFFLIALGIFCLILSFFIIYEMLSHPQNFKFVPNHG